MRAGDLGGVLSIVTHIRLTTKWTTKQSSVNRCKQLLPQRQRSLMRSTRATINRARNFFLFFSLSLARSVEGLLSLSLSPGYS